MYGERAMADAQKGSALGNLSYAHVAKTPTPSQRSPRPSAGRVAAISKLHPRSWLKETELRSGLDDLAVRMATAYAKIKENFDAGHLLSDSEKAELRRLAAQNFDPNLGSPRELSSASVSRLQDARSTEREARSKVASMRRMLQDARTEHAKTELRERRWAEAAAYRAQLNRDKPDLGNVGRFNEEELVGMAVRFVQRMAELEPDANKRGWYNLFKHMDDDGSGKISFPELVDLVRAELR